jgi:hypothetical protein
MPAQNAIARLGTNDANDRTVALGRFLEFDADVLATLAAGDATRTGIKLADQRINLSVIGADGSLRKYTMSVYVQREAETDVERAACAAVENGQKARKDAADAKAQAEREALIASTSKLTREVFMDSMRNVSALSHAAGVLANGTK